MTRPNSQPCQQNPFSAIYITPGAQPFSLPGRQTWVGLHAEFCTSGRRGIVLGQHGVGKTTFLASLMQEWKVFYPEAAGWLVCRVQGRQQQSMMQLRQRVAPGGQGLTTLEPAQPISLEMLFDKMTQVQMVIIDGFEAWPWLTRWRFSRRLRRSKAGIILTSHSMTPLPTLIQLQPDFKDFDQLIRHWQPSVEPVEKPVLLDVWQRHQGNLRECLFDLYQRWEQEHSKRASLVAPAAVDPKSNRE